MSAEPRPLAEQYEELAQHLPDVLQAAVTSLEAGRLDDAITDLRDAARLYQQQGHLAGYERCLLRVGVVESIRDELRRLKFALAAERRALMEGE